MGSIRHIYDEEDTGMDDYEGVAEVYVEREGKGLYQLRCNWSLLSKPSRPMTFSHVTFKYEKGGVFAFFWRTRQRRTTQDLFNQSLHSTPHQKCSPRRRSSV
ncbi:hypothetical protein [Vibrio parahaemolyticus]|uniref:hypothetical protein n=1 Tax=Vibrio parahaemolyticus TaxID=670 RepID=UPI00214BD372|nr:hypothetical protein [Vibrio parahaemolyticus]